MKKWYELIQIFEAFLKLGLTSFGGPVAHLGYFHDTFVRRKQWMSEDEFAETVALCQLLPGATSSQVGMVIGLKRAGHWGAFAAWLGFTLPSAIFMTSVAFTFSTFSNLSNSGFIRGLKLSALAVVAHASLTMFKILCPDTSRKVMAFVTAAVLIMNTPFFPHTTLLIISAIVGLLLLIAPTSKNHQHPQRIVTLKPMLIFVSIFFVLLWILPVLASTHPNSIWGMVDKFYRSGALVFGGGHVVLPLLSKEFVDFQLVGRELFLAGYGIAQAIPGPLFTFAAFLGVTAAVQEQALWVASVSLFSIFLPSFLLVFGLIPVWTPIKHSTLVKAASAGMNAAVVGFLFATLGAALSAEDTFQWLDFIVFGMSFVLLNFLRTPSWAVVLFAGFASYLVL